MVVSFWFWYTALPWKQPSDKTWYPNWNAENNILDGLWLVDKGRGKTTVTLKFSVQHFFIGLFSSDKNILFSLPHTCPQHHTSRTLALLGTEEIGAGHPPSYLLNFPILPTKKNRYDFAFDLKSYRREKLSKHAVSCFKYTSYFMLLLVFFPEDLDRLSGCHVHLGANTLRPDQKGSENLNLRKHREMKYINLLSHLQTMQLSFFMKAFFSLGLQYCVGLSLINLACWKLELDTIWWLKFFNWLYF